MRSPNVLPDQAAIDALLARATEANDVANRVADEAGKALAQVVADNTLAQAGHDAAISEAAAEAEASMAAFITQLEQGTEGKA